MLKRNLIANYLGQGWMVLMGFAFLPVYIRYLGIEAYGLIGLFAVLTAWLSLLDLGLAPTLAREMARFGSGGHHGESIRDLLRSIEHIAVLIAFMTIAGMMLGAEWIAESWIKAVNLPAKEAAHAVTIMGLVAALRLIEGIYRSSLIGLQQQVRLNFTDVVIATIRGLGSVGVLAWISPTLQYYFLYQVAVSIVSIVTLATLTYSSLPKADRPARFSMASLREIRYYAGSLLGITFLSLLLTQVDKILLSKLLILSEYGYYALASVVAGALYFLIKPIGQAFFPHLSQLHATGDEAGFIRSYHDSAQLVSVLAGSVAIVIIMFSKDVLYLWTADISLATRVAPLLSVLMFGNLLNGLMWIPYQAQLAYGWTSLSMRANVVAVLIIVPAIIWVAPRYGAEGAAWVWVGLNAGYVLVGVHFMYRRILRQEKWRWYRDDILFPMFSASAMAGLLIVAIPETNSQWVRLFQIILVLCMILASAACGAPNIMRLVLSALFSNRKREVLPS